MYLKILLSYFKVHYRLLLKETRHNKKDERESKSGSRDSKSKSKEVQSGQLAHAICNMKETLASYKVLPFACYMIVENTDLTYF